MSCVYYDLVFLNALNTQLLKQTSYKPAEKYEKTEIIKRIHWK